MLPQYSMYAFRISNELHKLIKSLKPTPLMLTLPHSRCLRNCLWANAIATHWLPIMMKEKQFQIEIYAWHWVQSRNWRLNLSENIFVSRSSSFFGNARESTVIGDNWIREWRPCQCCCGSRCFQLVHSLCKWELHALLDTISSMTIRHRVMVATHTHTHTLDWRIAMCKNRNLNLSTNGDWQKIRNERTNARRIEHRWEKSAKSFRNRSTVDSVSA